jgi:hypothetical protein
MPCGAGLVFRRAALAASGYPERGVLVGRDPVRLGAGEDAEAGWFVRTAGWDVWYTPTLRLRHVIPARRTGAAYLCRLHRGFGRAEVYLRLLARGMPPTRANRLLGLAWAAAELLRVLARFPVGFVGPAAVRPTWHVRWHHALGCVEGAARLLATGRTG